MAKPIATIAGTALRPGVSLNRRYYSPATIAAAVERAQPRLASGPPLAMLTFHGAQDDSEKIAGSLRSLTLTEDGSVIYTATLVDTPAGRAMLELTEPDEHGARHLEGVSIRGFWLDELRTIEVDGVACETADDLELDGLDFTKTPGVHGARVDTVTRLGAPRPAESAAGRTPIYESAEAHVSTTPPLTEAATPPPAVDVVYADPGYQVDKVKRYPLDSRGAALAAWSAIETTGTVDRYTAAQVKRFRGRTRTALNGHGVTLTTEGHLRTAGPLPDALTEMWPSTDRPGGFHVSLSCGEITVTVGSYCVDPHDLDRLARAAAAAAAGALAQIAADPDDDPAESASSSPEPRPPAATEATTTATQEDPAVADTRTPTPDAAPAAPETADERVARLVAEGIAAHAAAQAEAVEVARLVAEGVAAAAAPAETEEARVARLVAEGIVAAAAVETEEQRIARLVQAGITTAIQGSVERNGPPVRTGLVVSAEAADGYPTGWPRRADGSAKEIHEFTEPERDAHSRPALERYTMGSRSVFAPQA